METRSRFGAVPRAAVVAVALLLLTALVASAVVVGSSTTPKLPSPFGPASNGLIAFESDGDVYLVNPDGTDLRLITTGTAYEGGPAWSRDGSMLAYWSAAEDEGPSDLIVTNAAGAEPRTIATAPEAGHIEWSADSTEVMYSTVVPGLGSDPCPVHEGNGGACGSRLFVAKVDGSGSKQVGDPDLDARGPVLSPDGSTVAFGGGEAASEALYLMDWDGPNVERLETGIPGDSWAFAKQSWSADGQRIVTHDGQGSQSLWVVELDGSSLIEPGVTLGSGYWPTFSPDGTQIESATGVDSQLLTPESDSEPIRLMQISDTAWSPDSQQLVGLRINEFVVFDREGRELAVIAEGESPSWQRLAP